MNDAPPLAPTTASTTSFTSPNPNSLSLDRSQSTQQSNTPFDSTQHNSTAQDAEHQGPPQTAADLPPEALALATRLFNAARHGEMEIFGQALPRGGAGLANLTNEKGDSLIMLASYHGHASLVTLLLSYGADPNRLNDRGQSPLAGTVFKNERECVLTLLEGGADPDLGEPSALEATKVFRQEEYRVLFEEQRRKLGRDG